MVLGDFNLPSLGLDSETAQEFMAAMGLSQIILGPTLNCGPTSDMIFLLEQWQHDLMWTFGFHTVIVRSCPAVLQILLCHQSPLAGSWTHLGGLRPATNGPDWVPEKIEGNAGDFLCMVLPKICNVLESMGVKRWTGSCLFSLS